MTPALAAFLSMAVTAYLACGVAWALTVFIVRTAMDERVTAAGCLGQLLLWPWAAYLAMRGGSE